MKRCGEESRETQASAITVRFGLVDPSVDADGDGVPDYPLGKLMDAAANGSIGDLGICEIGAIREWLRLMAFVRQDSASFRAIAEPRWTE